MKSHVIATFDSPEKAEQAYYALQAYVNREDISIVHMSDDKKNSSDLSADTIADGIGYGALIGGGFGLAIGMTTLLIPGIGPILAVGPILSALTGVTAGGIVGGIVDLGINRYTAESMASHVERGLVVMTVGIANPALRETILDMLNVYGAIDVHDEDVEISRDQEPPIYR
ncbi:hypothetical protein ACQCN2_01880 [Brevibacillus ginsengisoli]|uniref:hypothetical protein n=1 Tax=Brevibacillus ginsengisoli TaxID=363854 RepID=UPI003CF4E366